LELETQGSNFSEEGLDVHLGGGSEFWGKLGGLRNGMFRTP